MLGSGLTATAAKDTPKESLLGLETKSQEPITITSDSAELNNQQYTAIYRGNVVVKRGDVTLYGDEIKSWFDKETKQITQIEARGRVRLMQADLVITAEVGTYYDQQQKIVLSGQPVCQKGGNVLEGSSITYFMADGKIMVEDAKSILKPKTTAKVETPQPKL